MYIYIHTDVQHRYKHAVFGPIVLGPEHFGATGFARSPTFGPLSQGKREHRPLGTGMVTVRFFFPLKIGGFLQLGVMIQHDPTKGSRSPRPDFSRVPILSFLFASPVWTWSRTGLNPIYGGNAQLHRIRFIQHKKSIILSHSAIAFYGIGLTKITWFTSVQVPVTPQFGMAQKYPVSPQHVCHLQECHPLDRHFNTNATNASFRGVFITKEGKR